MDFDFTPALTRARIEDYCSLFKDCFEGDSKLSEDYLKWQYLDNPDGQVIGVDAYFGDDLAAHYSVIPRAYAKNGKLYHGALSVNTATHPNYQGKGLFKKLAAKTYELAKERGVQFIIGVANANSIGGFTRRLEFKNLGVVKLYVQTKVPNDTENCLKTNVNDEWLSWRLKNPSRTYQVVKHRDGTSTIRTKVGKVSFNIARVEYEAAGISDLSQSRILPPGLTPVFGTMMSRSLLKVPYKLQPSPWHVIARGLDPDLESDFFEDLFIDGISMDTF